MESTRTAEKVRRRTRSSGGKNGRGLIANSVFLPLRFSLFETSGSQYSISLNYTLRRIVAYHPKDLLRSTSTLDDTSGLSEDLRNESRMSSQDRPTDSYIAR
jgi:hypothetical protein